MIGNYDVVCEGLILRNFSQSLGQTSYAKSIHTPKRDEENTLQVFLSVFSWCVKLTIHKIISKSCVACGTSNNLLDLQNVSLQFLKCKW